MGFCVDENIFTRTEADEFLQNEAVARIFRAGVELAVGKRACAALAELDIGGRVERTGRPEALHVALALFDTLSAFEQNRPCAAAGEDERAEQTARSRADDNGTHRRRFDALGQNVALGDIARDVFIMAVFQHGGFIFNLSGGGSVLEHQLQVAAHCFTENDAESIPTGRYIPVEGTPFDFRATKPIGRDIDADHVQLRYGKGYDHNYVLSRAEDAAVVWSEQTGIRMTMHTDMPGVQVYSGNNLDPRPAKDGSIWTFRHALCLETQLFPDAMHHYGFPSALLRAGEHLHSETSYVFDVK